MQAPREAVCAPPPLPLNAPAYDLLGLGAQGDVFYLLQWSAQHPDPAVRVQVGRCASAVGGWGRFVQQASPLRSSTAHQVHCMRKRQRLKL